jgi:iron complex transport system substrate-binding protein
MKSSRIVTGLVAILVISALLAGCRGSNTQALIFFTDDTGQIINLPKVPQRIVSIGPTITEVLVALGASEKIVGIDDFSYRPSTMVPIPRLGEPWPPGDVISPELGVDTDAIVALHPDLVIANVGTSEVALQLDF